MLVFIKLILYMNLRLELDNWPRHVEGPEGVNRNWDLRIFGLEKYRIWVTGNERHKNGKTQIPL